MKELKNVYYFKTSKVCNCDLESHFKLVWTVVGILNTRTIPAPSGLF